MAQTDDIGSQKSEQSPTRRSFLDTLIGGSLLMLAASYALGVLAYLLPASHSDRGGAGASDAGALADLPAGAAKMVQHGSRPVLIIHGEDGVRAFSGTCTHLGCVVQWDADRRQIRCPCHAGTFDLAGNVVSGPPPRALPTVPVSVRGGHIYIGGVDS